MKSTLNKLKIDAVYYPKLNHDARMFYAIVSGLDSMYDLGTGSYSLMNAVKMAIDHGYIVVYDARDGFIYAKESVLYYTVGGFTQMNCFNLYYFSKYTFVIVQNKECVLFDNIPIIRDSDSIYDSVERTVNELKTLDLIYKVDEFYINNKTLYINVVTR